MHTPRAQDANLQLGMLIDRVRWSLAADARSPRVLASGNCALGLDPLS